MSVEGRVFNSSGTAVLEPQLLGGSEPQHFCGSDPQRTAFSIQDESINFQAIVAHLPICTGKKELTVSKERPAQDWARGQFCKR